MTESSDKPSEGIRKLTMSIRNVISEFRKPTSSGASLIKYLGISTCLGLLFFKVVKPTWKEHDFYRNQEYAHTIYEMEKKMSKEGASK